MSERLRNSVIDSIASGQGTHRSYARAAETLTEEMNRHLERGTSLNQTLAHLGLAQNSLASAIHFDTRALIDPALMTLIVSSGGVATIPSAACVENHLKDNPNPTREDVEAAFAACSKGKP